MRTLSYPLLLVASLLAPGALRAQNAGDAARGKAIVEGKGGCLSCHRIKDVGSTFGPDLSEIGSPGRGGGGGAAGGAAAPSREMQLQTSLLDPSAEIAPTQRSYRVVTKAGETVTGRLVNLDTFTVQIFVQQEKYRSFQKSDLREFGFVDKSPMPSFKDRLTGPEVADVVAYLSSLKAPPALGAAGRGAGRGGAPGAPPAPAAPPAGAPPAEPH